MHRKWCRLVGLMTGVLATGCIPAGDGSPVPGRDALMAEWVQIANSPRNEWDVPRASLLVHEMDATGPDGLLPLFALLSDSAASTQARVLATITLAPVLRPALAETLVALTQPGVDEMGRSCAAQLLGDLSTPESTARLRELMRDASLSVRFTAVYRLLAAGDTEAQDVALQLWAIPELNANQRSSLVQGIPEPAAGRFIGVCKDAVLRSDLDLEARKRAVRLLVRSADPSGTAVLDQCASSDATSELRDLARAGAAALRAPGAEGEGGLGATAAAAGGN